MRTSYKACWFSFYASFVAVCNTSMNLRSNFKQPMWSMSLKIYGWHLFGGVHEDVYGIWIGELNKAVILSREGEHQPILWDPE